MIDYLTIVIALVIIATLVGFFGFLAWKINMSDPLTRDDNHQVLDSTNDKKKKEKNTTDQGKKKRKDQKKSKRENKDEEQRTKHKEPAVQTSEETDDEREESEQELSAAQSQAVETSSKARKRNKNKTQTTTEGNVNVGKNTTTTRAPPVTHPKSTPKDELESTKQQAKVQVKSSQVTNKQTLPATTTTKKPTQPVQKEQEQPFTVVGGNRNKTGTPPLQQQQNKSQVTTTSSVAPIEQTPLVPVPHEQLDQRQQLLHKETPAQLNSLPPNPLPLKQQLQQQTPTVSPKIADLIKVLPSSQAVVTELMSALDVFPLSTDELNIIMHKIANKQSVMKQDWTKLQHGQKVDPQAHIGQVMDESAKAYADDVKNNSMKRIKELTDELNSEKRRNNDLLKDKTDKDREIQILHAQLDSVQHKHEPTQVQPQQQQKVQTLETQLKRMTEENNRLNLQLTQQLATTSLASTGDSSNMKVQVLSEQIKKLSVDNANWEKKAHSYELLTKEAQKEKEDLIRYNEQLTQSLQNAEKDLKHTEERHHKKVDENRTSHLNEINEYKRRIEQLETDNEQLRREEIVHVEPTSGNDIQTITINTEEHEQFEKEINQLKQTIDLNQQKEREYNHSKQKLTEELEGYKKKFDDLQTQRQSQENEFKQEIERLKQEKNNNQQQADESRSHEVNALRTELNQMKSTMSQSEDRLRQEREKQRSVLTQLLPQDVRTQLTNNNQDFDQWLSSYGQLSESSKRTLHGEAETLKVENEQLRKNMTDIENQLKQIEKTVQSKEETLFFELKSKDATLETIRNENEQLSGELQRLRNENQSLQSAHDTSAHEARALKLQLDERFLVGANTPSVVADESFELVKQPSPSLSPIVIDIRAEQFNDLIRSSKEALENPDSETQQHRSEAGETSTSNVDESTVSSSSNQQS